MMRDYEREQKGKCKPLRVACGVGTIVFFFHFFLLNFSNFFPLLLAELQQRRKTVGGCDY